MEARDDHRAHPSRPGRHRAAPGPRTPGPRPAHRRLGGRRPSPVPCRRPPAGRHRRRGTHRSPARPGRPDHADPPTRRVLRPPRSRRPDRLRRGLPHRCLGRRRPGRLPHRPGRAHRHPGPGLPAEAAGLRGPPHAGPPPQHRGQQPGQHLAPLRPLQRALRALPRRDAELLLGPLRHLGHRARNGRPAPGRHPAGARRPAGRARPQPRLRRGAGPQDRAAARRGRGRRRHPGARDRHRLGRAGHPRRPSRRDRPLDHPVGRAARAGRAADRGRGTRRAGAVSSCSTTAPSAPTGRRTTRCCPSR